MNKYSPEKIDNSPVAIINRNLVPYRVTGTLDSIFYEFWIVGSKYRSDISNKDKDIKKSLATIDIKNNREFFTISYYSEKNGIQIVKDLPITDLQIAIEDLKNAGF